MLELTNLAVKHQVQRPSSQAVLMFFVPPKCLIGPIGTDASGSRSVAKLGRPHQPHITVLSKVKPMVTDGNKNLQRKNPTKKLIQNVQKFTAHH